MKQVLNYLKTYAREIDKRVLAAISLLTATLIYCNYHFKVDDRISAKDSFAIGFWTRFILFMLAFGGSYLLYNVFGGRRYFTKFRFTLLVIIAALIFAFKISYALPFRFSSNFLEHNYWEHIVYWPALLVVTTLALYICWKIFDREQPFYGLTTKGMNWKPYLIMLLVMVPLIAAASTQADFLAVYPKINSITMDGQVEYSWWQKILFELSYGSDFFTIELFFRGFLILAFVKWAGKDAILPMACFYCTIHFGKPLGECISSYFGGILLGVVIYHTRSIYGGLIVHLGIAWLMEIGGFLGRL